MLFNQGLGVNTVYPGSVQREQLRPCGAGLGTPIGGGRATSRGRARPRGAQHRRCGGSKRKPCDTRVPAPCSEGRLCPGCRRFWLLPGQCVWQLCETWFGPVPLQPWRNRGQAGRALNCPASGSVGVLYHGSIVSRVPETLAVPAAVFSHRQDGILSVHSCPSRNEVLGLGTSCAPPGPLLSESKVRSEILICKAPSEQHGHPTSADGSQASSQEDS